jgi:hypothetical protein
VTRGTVAYAVLNHSVLEQRGHTMRKLLAIAILISFIAPASAADWLGGSARGHSGTASDYSAAMRAAMARRRASNYAEIQAINAEAAAAADQSNAARNAAQDKARNARDAVRKMLDLHAQANSSGCIFCR